jgi:NAD(P)-dependent dehydrogenase (short-subunit alcohol dehydrogenase family)
MREFDGKVAVATGGASGIGLALATKAAQEGMKVVVADVEEKALELAVTALRHREFDVTGVLTDVSRPESVRELRDRALAAYGKVHLVFNNAGVAGGGMGPIWEASEKDWQWIAGVNLWGPVHVMRTFLPLMIEQGEEGHMVNTASVAGLVPGNGIYGVTKHAVVALSESIFSQLQMSGAKVCVSVLCPGFVSTRIYEADRNRPEELRNENARPVDPEARRALSRVVIDGIPPSEVADKVFDAVREGRFYILTHDDFDDVIRARFDNILARRNPAPRTAAGQGFPQRSQ